MRKALERLEFVNRELMSALIQIEDEVYDTWTNGYKAQQIARAAISRATKGESK